MERCYNIGCFVDGRWTGRSDMGSSISSIGNHWTIEFDCSAMGCYTCACNFQEALIEANDIGALCRIWWFDASSGTFPEYRRIESCGYGGPHTKLSVVGTRFPLLNEIKITSKYSRIVRDDNDCWRFNTY